MASPSRWLVLLVLGGSALFAGGCAGRLVASSPAAIPGAVAQAGAATGLQWQPGSRRLACEGAVTAAVPADLPISVRRISPRELRLIGPAPVQAVILARSGPAGPWLETTVADWAQLVRMLTGRPAPIALPAVDFTLKGGRVVAEYDSGGQRYRLIYRVRGWPRPSCRIGLLERIDRAGAKDGPLTPLVKRPLDPPTLADLEERESKD